MAKKQTKPAKRPGIEAGKVKILHMEITSDLIEALNVCSIKTRWTKKVCVEMALEAFLTTQGCWPPS